MVLRWERKQTSFRPTPRWGCRWGTGTQELGCSMGSMGLWNSHFQGKNSLLSQLWVCPMPVPAVSISPNQGYLRENIIWKGKKCWTDWGGEKEKSEKHLRAPRSEKERAKVLQAPQQWFPTAHGGPRLEQVEASWRKPRTTESPHRCRFILKDKQPVWRHHTGSGKKWGSGWEELFWIDSIPTFPTCPALFRDGLGT